ncbi:hypothetical protein [Deinococcus roseus]|uniref:Polyketide cyclase n=1 Tax=Deinococcus roseus TaxID=392414 RepID=A0ABQ2D230_9DEIO|nr:hypothetical protein [Deinococcus roseus]GGJ42715.1 hypothetical protein GCM10008938_31090 [Deinococcus roseus]
MQICTFKAQTTNTVQNLWQLWTNVKNWSNWDGELQEVQLTGPFKQGCTGTLVYRDGTHKTFTVIKLQVLESMVISIPYARGTELLIKRDMRQEGPEVHFEQDVTLSGTFITKMMMGSHKEPLRQVAGQQMQRMLELLEGRRAFAPDGALVGATKTAH